MVKPEAIRTQDAVAEPDPDPWPRRKNLIRAHTPASNHPGPRSPAVFKMNLALVPDTLDT